MAELSPSDRGRRADPYMVPSDLGGALGAEL